MARNLFSERGIGRKGKFQEIRGCCGWARRKHNQATRRKRRVDLRYYAESGGQDDRYHPASRYRTKYDPW